MFGVGYMCLVSHELIDYGLGGFCDGPEMIAVGFRDSLVHRGPSGPSELVELRNQAGRVGR